MNQIAAEFTSSPFIDQNFNPAAQNRVSRLDRLISSIVKALRRSSISERSIPQHQTFVQENLLDKNLGPEIARALR